MNNMNTAYATLLEKIIDWAKVREDIHGLCVIGSRAREETPADEYSDLDLIVITSNLHYYVENVNWGAGIGKWWFCFLERYPEHNFFDRRFLFDGGLDVDIVLVSTAIYDALDSYSDIVRVIAEKAIKVVLDKDGKTSRLLGYKKDAVPYVRPSENTFMEVVGEFMFHVVWALKKLARGEIWSAKNCVDYTLKQKLLTMIEWHAHALKGPDYNTWHDGRFIDNWADPRAFASLKQAFSHYDANDIIRALKETESLFNWIAEETAKEWGFSYPKINEREMMKWVEDNFIGEAK